MTDLPEDFHPTDMHWLPKSGAGPGIAGAGKMGGAAAAAASGGGKSRLAELFLITSAEGKLQLVGKGGRLEKPVEAHR